MANQDRITSIDEVFERWNDLSKLCLMDKLAIIKLLGQEYTEEKSKILDELISLGFNISSEDDRFISTNIPFWILIRFINNFKKYYFGRYKTADFFLLVDKMKNGEISFDLGLIQKMLSDLISEFKEQDFLILFELEKEFKIFDSPNYSDGLNFYKYIFFNSIIYDRLNLINIYNFLVRLELINDENRPFFLSLAIISENVPLFKEIVKQGPVYDETFNPLYYFNIMGEHTISIGKEIVDIMYKLTDDPVKLTHYFIKLLQESNLNLSESHDLYKHFLNYLSFDEIGELINKD